MLGMGSAPRSMLVILLGLAAVPPIVTAGATAHIGSTVLRASRITQYQRASDNNNLMHAAEARGSEDNAAVRIEIKPAGDKGMGAYASTSIDTGQYVGNYEGEIVTLEEASKRPIDYLFQLSPDLYIDASLSTHFSHYINHAHDGNLRFNVSAAARCVAFYAARPIAVGEELTYDYGSTFWSRSSVAPANGTDARDFSSSAAAATTKPLTATDANPMTATSNLRELEATLALPEAEARAGLLRTLEFFGAARLPCPAGEEPRVSIPFGLGPNAPSEVVRVADAPLGTLRAAAEACIDQAGRR